MKKDVHRFLWPRKALGMPVRMRSAPSTANAGSMCVSSLVKSGTAEEVADSAAELVLEAEEVAESVTVTLKVVGTAVVSVTSRLPEWEVVVKVVVAVVRESETEGEPVDEGLALLVVLFWANTGEVRRTRRKHDQTNRGQDEGRMAGMVGLCVGGRGPGGGRGKGREEEGRGRG